MITVNGYLVEASTFGDGTLKCPVVPGHILMTSKPNEIVWAYDNDADLFTLICVTRDIQNRLPEAKIILTMPYIPHARQDRNVSGRLFTLKYFCQLLFESIKAVVSNQLVHHVFFIVPDEHRPKLADILQELIFCHS